MPVLDLTSRLSLFADRSAVRLSHHDLLDGLTIDTYDGWVLLTEYRPQPRQKLIALAEEVLLQLADKDLPAHGAVLKERPDNLSHRQHEKRIDPNAITHLAGALPPTYWTVNEGDLIWQVSFTEAGFSTGIFLDMVEGRQVIRELAGRHPRVLNLFSFTGAFSIAAGRGVAEQIIEVDTHGKWLGWSQTNQKLNGITTVRQRREDAVKFLAKQDDASFDLIICDPPAYANPKKGKRFTIESGYREMAPHFARVLAPGGSLLACCNHAATDRRQFYSWLPDSLNLVRWVSPSPEFESKGNDAYLKIALLTRH